MKLDFPDTANEVDVVHKNKNKNACLPLLPYHLVIYILCFAGDHCLAYAGNGDFRRYNHMYEYDWMWRDYHNKRKNKFFVLNSEAPTKTSFFLYENRDVTAVALSLSMPVNHVFLIKLFQDAEHEQSLDWSTSGDGRGIDNDLDYLWRCVYRHTEIDDTFDMDSRRAHFRIYMPYVKWFMPTLTQFNECCMDKWQKVCHYSFMYHKKRCLIFALKVYFVLRMIEEFNVVDASAIDDVMADWNRRNLMRELEILASQMNRQNKAIMSEICTCLAALSSFIFEWGFYYSYHILLNPVTLFILTTFILVHLMIRVIWKFQDWWYPFEVVIKAENGKPTLTRNYLVKTEVTDEGVVYHCVVDGKSVVLSKAGSSRVEEMAMPGSILAPSLKRPVGAVVVAKEDVDPCVLGMFWRYGDYLITAKHVANWVSDSPCYVYLKVGSPNKNDIVQLDAKNMVRVENEDFDLDKNLFNCDSLDVFAMKLSTKKWAQIGLQAARCRKGSMFDLTITSVGFVNWTLMSGSGKTVQGGDLCEIKHTASTNKGFSGSPIFNGRDVIGMHVAGSDSANTAVRIESIIHYLPDESNIPEDEEYERHFKRGAYGFEIEEEHGELIGMTKRGKIKFLTEEELLEAGYDLTDKVYRNDVNIGRNYRDEHAGDKAIKTDLNEKRRPSGKFLVGSVLVDSNEVWKRHDNERAVHCASVPEENPAVRAFMNENQDAVDAIGYVVDEYKWPDITMKGEEDSLKKHMELYHKNCNDLTHPPDSDEIDRVAHVVSSMMTSNKFRVKGSYKCDQTILNLIHSNRVDGARSAGQPYQAEGMPTIADVIKNVGVAGLVSKVKEEWDSQFFIKIFNKSEPHKLKKIESGMIRIIKCFPVHKMIKHQLVLRPFMDSMVVNWRNSPIKYAFNPNLPGHCEHMQTVFKKFEHVVCMDKSNWDYNMFEWFFKIIKIVTKHLAVQDESCNDEEWLSWKHDVDSIFDEILLDVKNYCSNGHVYEAKDVGTMLSGFFGTIGFNSIAQLVMHVLLMLRLQVPQADICNADKYPFIGGGDDTMQAFEDMTLVDKYVDEALKLGFKLTYETTPFHGSEFFSTEFKIEEGVVKAYPKRITKHVENLLRIKKENLASALGSHMINHCWNNKMFKFLVKMYKHFQKSDPDLFPDTFLWGQRWLQYKSKGMESSADECSEYDPVLAMHHL